MFNPLYPFTLNVLEATVARGCNFFVRNCYSDGFIFTHYNDRSKATAHYNSISQDPKRFMYDWNETDHRERLKTAAGGTHGYKIYSSYFLPDYKKKITPALKEKINKYIFRYTEWKPAGGDRVGIDLYLQFGTLYLKMKFEAQELSCKFADVESCQ